VVGVLSTGAVGPEFETASGWDFSETHSKQGMGTRVISDLGKVNAERKAVALHLSYIVTGTGRLSISRFPHVAISKGQPFMWSNQLGNG